MFPRWLSWLVVAVCTYLIYLAQGVQPTPHKTPELPTVHEPKAAITALPPALKEATDIERWKRAINPEYASKYKCNFDIVTIDSVAKSELGLQIVENLPGEGDAARCGQAIRVRITLWGQNAKILKEKEIQMIVGAQELAVGLDQAAMGMRPGGRRTVLLPPTFQVHKPTAGEAKTLTDFFNTKGIIIVTINRLN